MHKYHQVFLKLMIYLAKHVVQIDITKQEKMLKLKMMKPISL
nr:MAG TPA: hypothetical protein [Crassvirales sp.]